MAMSSSTTTLTILALLPLIGWRMYWRVRRMIGRQRLSRVRPWITLIVFPLLLCLLALSAFAPPHPQPQRLAWLAAGLAIGGLLAVYGLKRTRFEPTPEGLYYTPDSRLGIALSVLFISRVLYRLLQLLVIGVDTAPQGNEFTLSPYTLGPVGMLFGYYIGYAIGLVRWRRRILRAKRERESAAQQQD
jgi:uncharacterized membrane protein